MSLSQCLTFRSSRRRECADLTSAEPIKSAASTPLSSLISAIDVKPGEDYHLFFQDVLNHLTTRTTSCLRRTVLACRGFAKRLIRPNLDWHGRRSEGANEGSAPLMEEAIWIWKQLPTIAAMPLLAIPCPAMPCPPRPPLYLTCRLC